MLTRSDSLSQRPVSPGLPAAWHVCLKSSVEPGLAELES